MIKYSTLKLYFFQITEISALQKLELYKLKEGKSHEFMLKY